MRDTNKALIFKGMSTIVRNGWTKQIPVHFTLSLSPEADESLVESAALVCADKFIQYQLNAEAAILNDNDVDEL